MSTQSNSECWLLNAEGTRLALCLPGECIGGPADGRLPALGTTIIVDRMGDMWFATFPDTGGDPACINDEAIGQGESRLLAAGDNRFGVGEIRFVLHVTTGANGPPAAAGANSEESAAPVSRHGRMLELFRDPDFHSGNLSEAMAKITFQAVEVTGADRSSLWLYGKPGGNVLELRARFAERGELAAPADENENVTIGPELTQRLGGITSRFLGIEIVAKENPLSRPGQEDSILDAATQDALLVGVGGGTEECLGFLVVERMTGAGVHWSPEDKLAAQGLAGLALQVFDAQEKKRALGRLSQAEAFLAAELKAAGNYIRRILPPPITTGAVRADWCFLPSAQLGGDSFGYHWVGGRFFVCYILDVVGHGSGAALLAISVSNAIRSILLRDAATLPDPATVLSHLNASFPMEEQSDLTFSMWFGIFDRKSRQLSYSSGGHPPGLLIFSDPKSTGKVQVTELDTEGVAIGSWADYPYTTGRVTIPASAKLFLYSDGAYEIPLENGRQWSFSEFVSLLHNTAHMAGGEVEYLRKRILSLLGAPAFPDDFSILRLSFDDSPV